MAGKYWEMPDGGKTRPHSAREKRPNIQQISGFDFGQIAVPVLAEFIHSPDENKKNMVIYILTRTSHQLDYFERRRKFRENTV